MWRNHGRARRSRECPREALRLLGRARDLATIEGTDRIDEGTAGEAAASLRIGQDGLQPADRRILDLLLSVDGPLGVRTIAATVGMNAQVIETIYEPFLIRRGYLIRTPHGRMATAKARALFGAASPDDRPSAAGRDP